MTSLQITPNVSLLGSHALENALNNYEIFNPDPTDIQMAAEEEDDEEAAKEIDSLVKALTASKKQTTKILKAAADNKKAIVFNKDKMDYDIGSNPNLVALKNGPLENANILYTGKVAPKYAEVDKRLSELEKKLRGTVSTGEWQAGLSLYNSNRNKGVRDLGELYPFVDARNKIKQLKMDIDWFNKSKSSNDKFTYRRKIQDLLESDMEPLVKTAVYINTPTHLLSESQRRIKLKAYKNLIKRWDAISKEGNSVYNKFFVMSLYP